MKIAIVVVEHPTDRGGAEVLYDGLERALAEAGHAVERIALPCDESTFAGILEGYAAARALDLDRFDLVISTKAPSFNLRHPRHVLFLLHTVRVFYDMFPSWTDGSAESRAQRDRIREMDFEALSAIPESRRFAIGEEVCNRLLASLGLTAGVLHPALADADDFHDGPFEHFLHSGRLHPWKRADLVIDAYRSLSTDVPLLVTGTGEAEADLRRRAEGDPRIRFLGEVSRESLYDLYSRALAVPFVPLREDFGYVAVEAMLSGKPVVTARDSGEPARLVENGKSGVVVEPRADAIAAALQSLLASPAEVRRMGYAGKVRTSHMRWDTVVERLVASATDTDPSGPSPRIGAFASRRTRVLIVDNQPIEPPIGGGRIRLFGLYTNLPSDLDPVYVGTYDWPGPDYRSVLHAGRLQEVTVPQSPAHFRAHASLQAMDPTLTMDVTFPLLSFLSKGFADRVAHEARSADVIVFSHPWVYPIVSRLPELENKPLIYDSQNVEGHLRRSLLGEKGLAGGIAEMVENLERELCARASAIFACSADDALAFELHYGVDPARIHVVPNGTNVHLVVPAADRTLARRALGLSPDTHVVVFVGSRYAPNAEAARFVWTTLAPALPEVRFVIAGGCTDELDPGEIPENVTVLGTVEAAVRDRVLAAADLAINPMSRGSGTNIKMFDFFAAGLPTVTTGVGARGLGIGAGVAYQVADLSDFAAQVRALLDSEPRRREMAASARTLAESRFDWRAIGATAGRVVRAVARGSQAELVRPGRFRLAVLSTWNTRCGIADYTASLTRGFPAGSDVRIYAEARSCGDAEPYVRKNWEIGLHDLSALESDLERDAVGGVLLQHNPAFFTEEAFGRLLRRLRERGIPAAITLHAAQGLRLDRDLAAELSRAARIYVHRSSDASWLEARGVRSGVHLLPQGIPQIPERSAEWVKSRVGLAGKFVVGHFGYLRPHKGVLELIEAFEVLSRTMANAHLLLLCAEYPSEDSREYRKVCEDRMAASPARDRIHASFDHLPLEIAGFLLQGCDVIVFPYDSSRESSSAAVRLAIASRRPIVVSGSGIFEELEGVAEVAPSREPEPLAAFLAHFAGNGGSAEARERLRGFAAKRDWSRVSSFVWGDLRSLDRAVS